MPAYDLKSSASSQRAASTSLTSASTSPEARSICFFAVVCERRIVEIRVSPGGCRS